MICISALIVLPRCQWLRMREMRGVQRRRWRWMIRTRTIRRWVTAVMGGGSYYFRSGLQMSFYEIFSVLFCIPGYEWSRVPPICPSGGLDNCFEYHASHNCTVTSSHNPFYLIRTFLVLIQTLRQSVQPWAPWRYLHCLLFLTSTLSVRLQQSLRRK